MKIISITADDARLQQLYTTHERRFVGRIDAANKGEPYIRKDECEMYLGLWKSMKAKNFELDRLTADEHQELSEACEDEDIPYKWEP